MNAFPLSKLELLQNSFPVDTLNECNCVQWQPAFNQLGWLKALDVFVAHSNTPGRSYAHYKPRRKAFGLDPPDGGALPFCAGMGTRESFTMP